MGLLWGAGHVRECAVLLRGVLKDPNKLSLEEESLVGP